MPSLATGSVFDITGLENLLLLLAGPGDEIICGGLIAECCVRGRPPYVAIIGDGAADGSAEQANRRERASRTATARLGLPAERLLFVGIRHGAVPGTGHGLFTALRVAMSLLGWRHDCNVVGAPFASPGSGDAEATWQLAGAVADQDRLALVACSPDRNAAAFGKIWRLDVRQWRDAKARAAAAHDRRLADDAGWETLLRL